MQRSHAHDRREGPPSLSGQDAMFEALVESRALWKDLCQSVGDIVFETDREGRLILLWPPDCLGWAADELMGRSAATALLLPPPPGVAPVFDPFRARSRVRLRQVWFRRADGGATAMAVSAFPTPHGGTRGVGIDITDMDDTVRDASASLRARRTVERLLRAGQGETGPAECLRAILAAALDAFGASGAALFRAAATGDGDAIETVQAVGTDWASVSLLPALRPDRGGSDRETPETPWPDGGAPDRGGPDVGGPDEAACLTTPDHAVLRAFVGDRLGTPCVLAVWREREGPDWTAEDRRVANALATAIRHLVEADSLRHDMLRASRTDLLTGLLDRHSFLADVTRRFPRLDHNGLVGTMLSIDLDGFRGVNARGGLEAGDAVLRNLAGTLRDTVRPTDLVARTGGDEFAVWLDGADLFAAAERADALCHLPVFRDTAIATCTGWSIGLATRTPCSSETAESLLRRADIAMLAARDGGRGGWQVSREEAGA